MGAIRTVFARIDAGFLVTLALTVFSGVYLTKVGVSPIYGTTILGIAMLAAWFVAARGAVPLTQWAQVLCTLLLAIAISIYQVSLDSAAGGVLNFVLGPILASLIPMSGRRLNAQQLAAIARAFILATLAVATVECAWRLTHPDFTFLTDATNRPDNLEDLAFYGYKFNSLMYIDSNFVGLQLALLLAFMLGLRRKGVRVPLYWDGCAFLLVLLTLSRASIFASMFLFCVEGYRQLAKGPVLKILVVLAVACGIVGAFFLIQNDISFGTKFDILNRFVNYLGRATPGAILFGVGVGHAVQAIGIGAHNVVVTYVIETGLVASLVILGYWVCLSFAVPVVGYMVLVWLVNGFSLTSLAIPYMYASAALLLLLHQAGRRPLLGGEPSAAAGGFGL